MLSTSNATVGQPLVGTVDLQNTLPSPLAVNDLVISYYEPGGTKASGPWGQIVTTGPMSLGSNMSYVLSGGHTFTSSDPLGTYHAYFTWQDTNSNWHDDTCEVPFTLSAGSSSSGSTG